MGNVIGRVETAVDLHPDREWIDQVLSYTSLPESSILPLDSDSKRKPHVDAHARIRTYVAGLTAKSERVRKKIFREIVANVGDVTARGVLKQTKDGYGLRLVVDFRDWEQWCLGALVALCQAGLDERMRMCSECKRDRDQGKEPEGVLLVRLVRHDQHDRRDLERTIERAVQRGTQLRLFFMDWNSRGSPQKYCSRLHQDRAMKRRIRQ